MIRHQQKSYSTTSRHSSSEGTTTPKLRPLVFLKAYAVTMGSALLLLLLTSLVLHRTPNPGALLPIVGPICALLTAFLGGIFSIRLHRHALLPAAWINTALLCVSMLLLSLLTNNDVSSYPPSVSYALYLGLFIVSLLGALVAKPKHASHPRKKAKKRRKM